MPKHAYVPLKVIAAGTAVIAVLSFNLLFIAANALPALPALPLHAALLCFSPVFQLLPSIMAMHREETIIKVHVR